MNFIRISLLALNLLLVNSAAHAEAQPRLPEAGDALAFPIADSRAIVIVGATVSLYQPHRSPQARASAPFEVVQAVALGNDLIFAASGLRANSSPGLSYRRVYAQYSIAANRWESAPAPPDTGALEFLVALDDVRALSGSISLAAPLPIPPNPAYIYDARNKTWRATANSNQRWRSIHGNARLSDGRVLFAHGSVAEVFDPVSEQWSTLSGLPGSTGFGISKVISLPQRKALILSWAGGGMFDGASNTLTPLPALAVRRRNYSADLLPNGDVVVAGGWYSDQYDGVKQRPPAAETLVIDPGTANMRSGAPMATPRAQHASALLSNGQLLLLGGATQYYPYEPFSGGAGHQTEYTASVETYAWEPEFNGRLEAGSYTVTVGQSLLGDDGFWGIEAHTAGTLDGGLNFGGLLDADGTEPGFAAFFVPVAQTVSVRATLQNASPIPSNRIDATMRIVNGNGEVVAGPMTGDNNLMLTANLSPGFHVVELRSIAGDGYEAAFQVSVSASRLAAGGAVGGLTVRQLGVAGFINFYLGESQDVRLRLLNRNSYGQERGAGEVILNVHDSSGRLVYRSGPGVAPPASSGAQFKAR